MYDFDGDHDRSGAPASGPPRALLALEAPRVAVEYAASRAIDLLRGHSDVGGGRPVLVIPGFMADDRLTGRLRGHLWQHGFHAHGWRGGRNVGLTDAKLDGLTTRFDALRRTHRDPVSIVGWSFGGVLARWLAHTHPDDVRQIVCLGSPWRADGEKTRATAMFERSRRRHGLSDRAHDIIETVRREPVPVPTSAVWSRTDGIVPWRGCRVHASDAPAAENIEVLSSHCGMVANPLVLRVVLDRLGQDTDDWQPYRGGCGTKVWHDQASEPPVEVPT